MMSSSHADITSIPDTFIVDLHAELQHHHHGISEYDLLQHLKTKGYFADLSQPATPDELFRVHFVLFHCLYRLHDQLLQQQQGMLAIHTLKICLLPYTPGEVQLQKADPLRDYYLDLSQLEQTTVDDVYAMLASFWNKMDRHEHREAALAELGLQDPVDDSTIKAAYRRLAMQHHPDRGGDSEQLQRINQAVDRLLGKTTK